RRQKSWSEIPVLAVLLTRFAIDAEGAPLGNRKSAGLAGPDVSSRRWCRGNLLWLCGMSLNLCLKLRHSWFLLLWWDVLCRSPVGSILGGKIVFSRNNDFRQRRLFLCWTRRLLQFSCWCRGRMLFLLNWFLLSRGGPDLMCSLHIRNSH